MEPMPSVLHTPFPDGVRHFYDPREWRCLPAAFRDSSLAWRARKALAKQYDHDWLQRQTFASHPISGAGMFKYNRWRLARHGLALDAFSISKETRARLLSSEHHVACAAELDVGLVLKVSGWDVVHEPLAPARGPDLRASRNGQDVYIEVKCPQLGRWINRLENMSVEISTALSAFAAKLALPGWSIELVVSESELNRAAADATRAWALRHELENAIALWARKPHAGKFRCSLRGCAVAVRRANTPNVQLSGPGFAGDPAHQTERLLRLVYEAADQLQRAPGPGYLVLADERNGLVGNHAGAVCHALRTDPLLSAIAGFLIYDLRVLPSGLVAVVTAYVRAGERSRVFLNTLRRRAKVDLRLF